MTVEKILPVGFGSNAYLVTADGGTMIAFDPSNAGVLQLASQRGGQVFAVFLTHCHFDHVGGVSALQKAGAKVYLSEKEFPLVGTEAELFELAGLPRTPYAVDETLGDNGQVRFGDLTVTCLMTPGHTAGSCSYLVEDKTTGERALFTGDTLFAGTIGRTDFPTGDIRTLRASLLRLAKLDDMPVYAGHNEDTTIGLEKQRNPFMRG